MLRRKLDNNNAQERAAQFCALVPPLSVSPLINGVYGSARFVA